MIARLLSSLFLAIGLIACVNANSANDPTNKTYQVNSPDGAIKVVLSDAGGELRYTVSRDGLEVIQSSLLGLRFSKYHDFDADMSIVGSQLSSADSTWEQPWGENRFVRDHHNLLRLVVKRVKPE